MIKMTFVFSGFLCLSKCYNEFRSFQAKYPNPCSCLQQMSSEAVLTTSLISGSLIETVSLQVLLNFLFPCSFFPPHYPLFSIQEPRATSKPCPDFYGPLFFSCEGGPQEMQANPSCGSLPPSSDWHKHRPLCSCSTCLTQTPRCALHLQEPCLYLSSRFFGNTDMEIFR